MLEIPDIFFFSSFFFWGGGGGDGDGDVRPGILGYRANARTQPM